MPLKTKVSNCWKGRALYSKGTSRRFDNPRFSLLTHPKNISDFDA